ncbi:MAG: flavodoxin domain-containing protein [Cellulosilyticaceae bacterium]
MEKGIILFQSKYGATKKYADWLVEDLSFECIETSKAKIELFKNYDTIILCGGIYASGIAGLPFLKKNHLQLAGKKICVLCVGASPFDKEALQQIKTHNFKEKMKKIPLFYARGSWDEGRMTFKYRTLCKLLQKAVAKKDPATYEPWEKALMCAVDQTCDWTDKSYLKTLLEYINQQ